MTVTLTSPLLKATADPDAKDLEEIPLVDNNKYGKMMGAEAEPCYRCQVIKVCPNCGQKLGLLVGLRGFGFYESSHNARCQMPKVNFPKEKSDTSSIKPVVNQAVKIGRSTVAITTSEGIDASDILESKLFTDLKDALAKRKGCDISKIHVQSVVGKLRSATYKVLHRALPVNETEKRSSGQLVILNADTIVKVLEIHDEDDAGRVRARIEEPAGWISISHHGGTQYAEAIEASHDISFADFLIDAKVDGKKLSGINFMRGNAVAILIILHVEGAAGTEQQNYTLLVEQDNVPLDLGAIAEIPSGTIDKEGNFTGCVAKDISEKTGIQIKTSDLVDVTAATYKDESLFPRCGAENFTSVFVLQERTTVDDFESLKTSLSAQVDGGMKLRLVALDTLDNRTLPAVALYDKLDEAGQIRQIDSKEWHFGTAVGSAMGQFVRWMS